MAKNKSAKRQAPVPRQPDDAAQPATLKDLLRPDIVAKLKDSADAMKAEEAKKREAARIEAEEAKLAEQKRLDNDFGYLLEQSLGKRPPRKN